MCGICGIIAKHSSTKALQSVDVMLSSLAHRGPDGVGKLHEKNANFLIDLGHTRLSILDLGANANQPMAYENLSIVYNGEVYNFTEIKEDLRNSGYSFTTSSDTEVILKAIHKWGIEACLRFNGMFAIAIFDRRASTVTLVRDRLGVKPLFYCLDQSGLVLRAN